MTHQLSRIATVLALLLGMPMVFAIDYGGVFTNNSKFAGNAFDELLLDQKNVLGGWVRIPFDEKGTTYVTAEALYQFNRRDIDLFNNFENRESYDASAFDIDLFKFATKYKNDGYIISIASGRFFTTDVSGNIFAQNADGILAAYESSTLNVSAYGAFTGLLNARTVSILDPDFQEDTDKYYQRATDYIIGALTLSLPNIWANQTISFQALGTFRLQEKSYNRLYGEVAVLGPIVSTLFYNLTSVFELAKNAADSDSYEWSNLSKATLTYYVPYKNASAGMHAIYASGAQGPFTAFTGFTSQTATNALFGRTEYTGLAKLGMSASIKPIRNILLGADCDIVFNAAAGDDESVIEYEGFQYALNASWQIVSDVQIAGTIYQYFDDTDSSRDKSCIELKAAVSF